MKRKALIISAFLVAILTVGGIFVGRSTHDNGNYNSNTEIHTGSGSNTNVSSVSTSSPAPSPIQKIENKVTQLATNIAQSISKPSVLLNVAFASQAPFGVWDALHEDSCEEAAVIIAHNYVNKLPLNNQIMEDGLLKMIKWEDSQGFGLSITISEVQRVMNGFLKNGKTRIINDPTVEDLKKELAAGNPIIVPAAGRELGNPNFTAPGPVYHMYVLIGYDDERKEFITNDPGTRLGAKYRYSYDVVMSSMHDWNEKNIDLGGKTVLVVEAK